jgi:cytochrome c oxidase subunit 2
MHTRLLTLAAAIAASAVGIAGCGSSGSTSTSTTTPSTTTQTTASTADIDAKALFVSGNATTGAMACGGCHKLAAAGTAGAVGPDLDKIAPDDNAEALTEMIVNPDAEIVEGYSKGLMPTDYSTKLTKDEVAALASYIDTNSAHAEN